MAGLAALMTRKKRDRRRELELKLNKQETGSITEIRLPLTGKEAQEALQKKAAHESIKKILVGKELLHQKSKSFDALSQVSYNEDDDSSNAGGNPYSLLYIGLILICIGVVITFVGLGEKGFKTLELKLIGPILCLVGLACIVVKIIQCTFPKLCQLPPFLNKIIERRTGKLRDSDRSNLMEKGGNHQNGHLGNNSTPKKDSPQILSPRVTLQSAKKTPRPRSTIPNYIEDSSDDDDFDKSTGRSRPDHSESASNHMQNNVSSSSNHTQIQVQQSSSASQEQQQRIGTGTTMTTVHRNVSGENKSEGGKDGEIVLTPKGLML